MSVYEDRAQTDIFNITTGGLVSREEHASRLGYERSFGTSDPAALQVKHPNLGWVGFVGFVGLAGNDWV